MLLNRILLNIYFFILILNLFAFYIDFYTLRFDLENFITFVYFDYEKNLPTFFSSVVLFYSSYILYSLFKEKKEKEWLIMSFIFLYLSFDEFFSIHENILYVPSFLSNYHYFPWAFFGGLFSIFFFLFFYKFLLKLNRKTFLQMCIAGFLFVLGSIGFDTISSNYFYEETLSRKEGYIILSIIEESLEILSILYFNYVLLKSPK